MKHFMTLCLAAAPCAASAHPGGHSLTWGDAIRHAVAHPNHAVTLIAVLTLPTALLILARRT